MTAVIGKDPDKLSLIFGNIEFAAAADAYPWILACKVRGPMRHLEIHYTTFYGSIQDTSNFNESAIEYYSTEYVRLILSWFFFSFNTVQSQSIAFSGAHPADSSTT